MNNATQTKERTMDKVTLEVTDNDESTGFYRIEILEHGNRCDFIYHGKQLHNTHATRVRGRLKDF